MSQFIGIDYGLERTGLAISAPEGSLAFPLTTLELKKFKNRGELFDKLAQIILTENARAIVWGLPLNIDGTENMMCAQVRNASRRLNRRISLPIFFMPEILSSFEAERDLRERGLKGEKLKQKLDQQSACRILTSFLALDEKERSSL